MHHIQVACLVRHGRNDLLRNYQVELVDRQYLLASATTEVGTGGDVRSSVCAVDVAGGTLHAGEAGPGHLLRPVRRRDPGHGPPVGRQPRERSGARPVPSRQNSSSSRSGSGTPSASEARAAPGSSSGPAVTPAPSSTTPTPTSPARPCCPWPTCCGAPCGWASPPSAIDRARRFVQAEAQEAPGHDARRPPCGWPTPPRCSSSSPTWCRRRVARFEDIQDDPDRLSALGFAIAMNSLKVSASTLVVDIVRQCMVICGLASYRMDTPYSLGRHLRDSMGAVAHGQQRPDHGQQRPDAAGPPGRVRRTR